MIQEIVHQKIIENIERIQTWFDEKSKNLALPIYTSLDIRDSGYKVSSIDANVFPAGFNNICDVDQENAPEIFKQYLDTHYDTNLKKILLITEEHTNNSYYWQNIYSLCNMLEKSGREVRLAMPKEMESIEVETAFGQKLKVYGANREGDHIELSDDFEPDLVISNNDFSLSYEDWYQGLNLPLNPPRELGWYQRKKSTHFEFYNELAKEFAELIDLDPWVFQVESELFSDFNINSEESKAELAAKVDEMIERIRSNYAQRGIKDEPVLFIKNNSGTYGLAVTPVKSGKAVLDWNYKTRKKMKAAKGGRDVEELLLQEGIPSIVKTEDAIAEPVLYLVGRHLIGGFLRTHKKKGESESLNSPGAVYQRMCVTDLKIDPQNCPHENVYGWVAKLSAVATGLEAKKMQVEFKNYH